ncbi:NAD-dependent deacetylase [Candidatus Uabimicrobium sp. HlEnr_7]|uniref:SIR2 family NAD-dependent protein deacylase n=1 Tax=Candidatus Uabimicrobium helgolandensis TaxID=3095367 RepID=UPI003557D864
MNKKLMKVVEILQNTSSLLVISGSGISQESGIPTYRGNEGLYNDKKRMLHFSDLKNNPDKVWFAVDEMRRLIYDKKPNRGHQILSDWERSGMFSRFLIATQNIDNLHQEAGSERVCEIHGNVWKLAQKKQKSYAEDQEFNDELLLADYPEYEEEILKKWSEENGYDVWMDKQIFSTIPPEVSNDTRPHIHFFDELYNDKFLWVKDFAKRKVDTVLIIGCSGKVSALHIMIDCVKNYNQDSILIDINCQNNNNRADVDLRGRAVDLLEEISGFIK